MFQDILSLIVRPAAILTTSYVPVVLNSLGYEPLNLGKYNQLVIYHAFTLGSLTSASLIVEFSPDQTTWYQETSSSISSGADTLSPLVHTVTASGNYRYVLPIKDPYVRISVLGTGTVTGSSSAISANLGAS